MWPNASETAYCRAVWPGAGAISIFFVWPGLAQTTVPVLPQTQWIIQWERARERGSVCVCAGEAWCLSLPWSPMALLTIQHPPNYPPIHSQRDKARDLVCWNNMATNLSHSNITPTPLSLEVRCAPQSPPQHPSPHCTFYSTNRRTCRGVLYSVL